MGRRGNFVIRAIVTLVIMSVCVSCFCELVRKKGTRTITYSNFYRLPEESVDVIFLGSSHSLNAFIPQELYNEYGITSYNLSSPGQPPLVSYYWLKETLKTQKPKTVVLDTNYIPEYKSKTSSEYSVRSSLEHMCLGAVKIEAIHEACKTYSNLSELSFYLPNIRYHDRWKDLWKDDFLFEEYALSRDLKGADILTHNENKQKFTPFRQQQLNKGKIEPLDEYTEKIGEFCVENNIKLILVKTPNVRWTINDHNSLETFANKNNLPFYDMNVDVIYRQIDYDYNKYTNDDGGHSNFQGAIKLTHFIGKILRDEYGLQPHKSKPWENKKKAYENVKADYELQNEKNLNKYLSLLKENKERYTIFIAVKDEASKRLNKKSQKVLSELGLTTVWDDAYRKSYYAVIEGGKVLLDEMSAEELTYTGSFCQGRNIYTIKSAGKEVGNSCSIKINRKEKAKGKRGLNIVVFNNERQRVIDSVCFDTFDVANKIFRVLDWSGT